MRTTHLSTVTTCIAGCVVLTLAISACSVGPSLEVPPASGSSAQSIVFVIHGDGNYQYHDAAGTAISADAATLADAVHVAKNMPRAEVFIFHQKRQRGWLFFRSRTDSDFYLFKNGTLISQQSYRRAQGTSRFEAEIGLFDVHRSHGEDVASQVFLYFGHEVPEYDGEGYDASHASSAFTVDDLAQSVGRFSRPESIFDLVVLSTCYGGTPYTVSALAPFTKSIVASPDVLHLSYFSVAPLMEMDAHSFDGSADGFPTTFARHAYDTLSTTVQTPVTVVVYDTAAVEAFLRDILGAYVLDVTAISATPTGFAEHQDCANSTTYARPEMHDGVRVFYQPARFGRAAGTATHSGWECWQLPLIDLPSSP